MIPSGRHNRSRPTSEADWRRFEALAALRWLQINRWLPLDPSAAPRALFQSFATEAGLTHPSFTTYK